MTESREQSTKLEMGIDPYERNWIYLSIGIIVVFFGLITVAGFALGIQVPGPESRVNPQTLGDSGGFANPGLREIAPGEYEAYVIARTFFYEPNEIVVPVGSKVDNLRFQRRCPARVQDPGHQRQHADRSGPGLEVELHLRPGWGVPIHLHRILRNRTRRHVRDREGGRRGR